jgi:flagellin-specific chaperone FliS
MAMNIAASYQKVQLYRFPGLERLCYNALFKKPWRRQAPTATRSDDFERFERQKNRHPELLAMIRSSDRLGQKNCGEIAANQDNLYSIWRRPLHKANIAKDKQLSTMSPKMVKEMHDAWIVPSQRAQRARPDPGALPERLFKGA